METKLEPKILTKVLEEKTTNEESSDPTATVFYNFNKSERLLLINLLILASFYPNLLKDLEYPYLFNIPLSGELFSSGNPIVLGQQNVLPTNDFSEAILQNVNESFIADQTSFAALENTGHSFIFTGYSTINTNFAPQELLLSDYYQNFAANDSLTTNLVSNLLNSNAALNETALRSNNNDANNDSSIINGALPNANAPDNESITIPGITPPLAFASAISGTEDATYTFAVSDFNFAPDILGNPVQSLTIQSLPADGLLEIFNGSDWVAINIGDVISIADIDAGYLRFTGDLHESGNDQFTTPGVGPNHQDYASFKFSVSDGVDTSNQATMTIDLASVFQPTEFSDAEGYVRLYSDKYLTDSKIAFNAADGSTLYSVNINDGSADLSFIANLSNTAFLDHGQIAVNNLGTTIHILESQPTEYAQYDLDTDTLTTITTGLSPANPQVNGIAYYNDNGTELVYVFSINADTVVSYNINVANPFSNPVNSYGPFTIANGPAAGLIYDFNGGDIVFDEYGQAYAVSNTRVPVAGKEGGFAKINFDDNTVTLLNDDEHELVNLSSMIYDPVTQLFYVGRTTTVTGTDFEAFLVLDKNGNILDSIPIMFNGLNFDHTGGDGASTLQVEYAVPVEISQVDTDGSQVFTSLTLTLTNSVGGDVLDAQLFYHDVALNDGSTVNIGGSTATVSIVDQTWTLTWDDPSAVQIDDTLTFRTSTSQTADFTVDMTAISTELSTGDSGSSHVSFTYEPLKPIITNADVNITHDETTGIDNNTNDVSADGLPAIFDSLEADNSLSDPIGQAQTAPGMFGYFVVPGMGFVADVALTQQNGDLFNGQDTGLLSMNNNSIFLYQDADNNMVIGREGNGSDPLSDGDIIFALYLDQGLSSYGSSNDTLWLAQYQQILHPDSLDPNEPQSITDLIYLTVESTTGEVTTSSDAITVTILDDDDEGSQQMMSMMFSGFSEDNSEIGSNDESGLMSLSMSLEDDSSDATDSNINPANDDSSQQQGGDAITNEMVFENSNDGESNPVLNEQQGNLEGVSEVQQNQQEATDAPTAGSDAISQSMQEADQQAQQGGGGG